MKIKFIILICLFCNLLAAQQMKEYVVTDFPVTRLEVDAPKDTVRNFLKTFWGGAYFEDAGSTGGMLFRFPDTQFFDLKKDVLKFKKEGRTFHNVYDTYSLMGSEWELNLKEITQAKTQISFEMKKVLVNPEYFRAVESWDNRYKGKEKEFVSNEVLEDLIQTHFKIKSAVSPLSVVDLKDRKVYRNEYYGYEINLEPQTKLNDNLTINKEVSKGEATKTINGILVYDRKRNKLVLFDLDTKSLKWSKEIPNEDDQNQNGFTQYQNTIYLATGSGYVYAIDVNSGEIYWKNHPMGDKKLKGGLTNFFFGQNVPVSDDKIFVNEHGTVYALNRFTGKALWAQEIGNYGHYNYSFDKDFLYKSGVSETFQIRKSDGKVSKLWNSVSANTFYSNNLLSDKMLYFSADYLYCYDISNDKLNWKSKDVEGSVLSTITPTDYIFLSHKENSVLQAVDKKSGEVKWKWKPDNKENVSTSFLGENDAENEIMVLVQYKNYDLKTEKYTANFVNKSTGKQSFSIEIPGKIISNSLQHKGSIYVQTADGFINIDRKNKKIIQIPFDFLQMQNDTNFLNYAVGVK